MGTQRNEARKEQARDELTRLGEHVDTWLKQRAKADPSGQYDSQLRALNDVLERGRAIARAELEAVPDTADSGTVYLVATRTEERAAFLRRYWEYFRGKWDQRDDELLGPVTRSADEVVWSCWKPVFDAAERDTPAPAPLPYVEPHFTPRAIERHAPPPDLRFSDAPLQRLVALLPIPLIGLPPVCVQRPWWLIFLAHETAHHLHRELRLVYTTEQLLPDACKPWNEELFADAVSVLLCGSAATWALAELLHAPPEVMAATPKDTHYPPALTRLRFMAQVLAAIPVPAQAAVPPAEPAEPEALVTAKLLGEKSLRDLCVPAAKELRIGGEIAWWRDEYAAGKRPLPQTTPEAARRSLAGAVAAWHDTLADAATLRENLLATLPLCHPDGKRDIQPTLDTSKAVDALEAVLLGAP